MTVKIWQVSNNSCLHSLEGKIFHSEAVVCFDMFAKNKLIFTGGDDRVVCISNYDSGNIYKKTEELGDVQSIACAER